MRGADRRAVGGPPKPPPDHAKQRGGRSGCEVAGLHHLSRPLHGAHPAKRSDHAGGVGARSPHARDQSDALNEKVMHYSGGSSLSGKCIMATSKPRITITLPPEQHALLQRLAGLQGGSMSAVLVDMLESVRPALERVCAAMEQAKAMHDGMREQLRQAAEESERAMQPHVAAALGQLDWLVEQIGTVGAQPRQRGKTPVL